MGKVLWHSKEVLNKTRKIVAKVTEGAAHDIENKAKQILKHRSKTHSERSLLTQFEVKKSKFKDGGHLVVVQGAGNWQKPYRASFVELGAMIHPYGNKNAPKVHVAPKPYLRPALHRNTRTLKRKMQKALDRL